MTESIQQSSGEIGFLQSKGREVGAPLLSNVAVFRLNREFDKLAGAFAYKFLSEIYHEYGRRITLLGIDDGCVRIAASFASATDCSGNEFRDLLVSDERYHEILYRFDVEKIVLHNFENGSGEAGRLSSFDIDKTGRPVPPS